MFYIDIIYDIVLFTTFRTTSTDNLPETADIHLMYIILNYNTTILVECI